MKSLPVYPKKTGYKKPNKYTTAKNGTGKNNRYGTLKRINTCSLFYNNAGFKFNNKVLGRRDRFSIWEK